MAIICNIHSNDSIVFRSTPQLGAETSVLLDIHLATKSLSGPARVHAERVFGGSGLEIDSRNILFPTSDDRNSEQVRLLRAAAKCEFKELGQAARAIGDEELRMLVRGSVKLDSFAVPCVVYAESVVAGRDLPCDRLAIEGRDDLPPF